MKLKAKSLAIKKNILRGTTYGVYVNFKDLEGGREINID